jgi:hypothetical protein
MLRGIVAIAEGEPRLIVVDGGALSLSIFLLMFSAVFHKCEKADIRQINCPMKKE